MRQSACFNTIIVYELIQTPFISALNVHLPPLGAPAKKKIGITVANSSCGTGVTVLDLDPNGLCFQAGIHVGDVVLAVNRVWVCLSTATFHPSALF